MTLLKGVFTPAITIFDAEGRLDFPGNEQAILRLITNGVNGILFLGSIGEFFNMTLQEKLEFIDFAVETVGQRGHWRTLQSGAKIVGPDLSGILSK
jgi:dihydrodipicolinate synthase/N-acetylneuraminate lyase